METSSSAGWPCSSSQLSLGHIFCTFLGLMTANLHGAQSSMDQFMAKRGYTAVDIRHESENHLTTTARINGKSAYCWIDTGCTDLVLDTRRTGGLKATGRTATPAKGLFGQFATDLPTVWVDRFELNGLLFSNQVAVVSSLHRDSRTPIGSYIPKSSADAIIGVTMLKNMHAWIDCYAPRLYIRVEPPDSTALDTIDRTLRASGYVAASARLDSDRLFTEALINDRPAFFEIDTGSFDTLIALDQLGAFKLSNQEQLGYTVDMGGHKGDLKYTRPDSFKIAEFELKRYPVGTVNLPLLTKNNEKLKEHNLPPLVGLIGPDVLEKSRALIDWSTGRMYVMPEKPPQ